VEGPAYATDSAVFTVSAAPNESCSAQIGSMDTHRATRRTDRYLEIPSVRHGRRGSRRQIPWWARSLAAGYLVAAVSPPEAECTSDNRREPANHSADDGASCHSA
jgi:hypothetical protein